MTGLLSRTRLLELFNRQRGSQSRNALFLSSVRYFRNFSIIFEKTRQKRKTESNKKVKNRKSKIIRYNTPGLLVL